MEDGCDFAFIIAGWYGSLPEAATGELSNIELI